MRMYNETAMSKTVAELYAGVMRRSGVSVAGGDPVELLAAFVRLCLAQSCGKCTPCRVGLARLADLLDALAGGEDQDIVSIRELAQAIYDSADCAIGFEAARLVLDGLGALGDRGRETVAVPCSSGCPAHVDIPGYIACIAAGRFADAVRVIRRDNPFPSVCGLVCEHPCERLCRRQVVDDAINIRGLKRYAVEQAKAVPAPAMAAANGRRVAIVGGGPAGLTAAYFLALKGFAVTVYERRRRLGGMLRYGIPAYRLPDRDLDWDIEVILSLGIKVECGVEVGGAQGIAVDRLLTDFDAVYVAIGAHGAKKLGVDGENAQGVLSAVELLGAVGDGQRPDFTGKRVVIVGGGNVAMDVTRTARRLGAQSVTCVYRRRIVDMTALPEEVAGAQAEGCEMLELMAPVRIVAVDDQVTGLVVRPQLPGAIKGGRPTPENSAAPEVTIPADIIIVAIGQAVASEPFAAAGIAVKRGAIVADSTGRVEHRAVVFTGGDCWSGPATVIRAIDAGKIAAANIGGHFGIDMAYGDHVEIPPASAKSRLGWGRVTMRERAADERRGDFDLMEQGLTDEEAMQECSRCLRCDHYGKGVCGR